MRVTDVTMPAGIAARPLDDRGYPVPAITPWEDGTPQFASTSMRRVFLCVEERRCTVCGTEMQPGPVWRVVDGDEAEMISAVLGVGKEFLNSAPTGEAPGHRTCMIYAAMVCPFLSSPEGRRSEASDMYGADLPKGDARGSGGAVVAYNDYGFKQTAAGPGVVYGAPIEIITYNRAADLQDELTAALANDETTAGKAPAWLGENEQLMDSAFRRAMLSPAERRALAAQKRAAQARKRQQKQARTSRKKNR
ncbi:hypothetical protein J7E96_27020 [Streptomyces sp. ISL-96]|uniref:hypothetical protein n=1 Tax=Streptomyces sp. ISL-96 TaxID=2819191 RepID=UPI001BE96814|nr:hypothetical protein [Streptomyces sp. ISL-96]MBT2492106.1 hypothetical protein [Streptomyces sp. ISL-96]